MSETKQTPIEALDRFIAAFPRLQFAAADKKGKFPMAAMQLVEDGSHYDIAPFTVAMPERTWTEIKALVAALPAIRAAIASVDAP